MSSTSTASTSWTARASRAAPLTASTRACASATSIRRSASTAGRACPSARSMRSSPPMTHPTPSGPRTTRRSSPRNCPAGTRRLAHRAGPSRRARWGRIRRWSPAGSRHDRGRARPDHRRRHRRHDRRPRAGAGIQLAPNALRVLDGLGVLPELAAAAVRLRHLVFMHAETGQHLTTVDFGEAFERRYGYPYTVMHRGDLLTVLHQACRADDRITLEASRDVVGLSDEGGTARVRFADGGGYECGAVVGADGLWSTARSLISADRPVCQKFVAYRGALPAGGVSAPAGGSGVPAGPDDEIIWIGPGKHLVQYPIRRGELYNQVAVFGSRSYSREAELKIGRASC